MQTSEALRRGVGLGLLTAATLAAELILTRILSAGLYHHLAFLVVSTALLGTAVAGVAVSVRSEHVKTSADHIASGGALAFAVGLPITYALSQAIAVEPLALAADASQIVRLGVVYVLLAIPFFASGLAVAALLHRYAASAPRLYAADLLGAGIGSLAALGLIPVCHGPDGLLATSALAAGAAIVWSAGKMRIAASVVSGLAAILAFVTILSTDGKSRWLPLHISKTKTTRPGRPYFEVLKDPRRTISTRWTTVGRVDRVRFGRGTDRLVIDAGAAAVRVPPKRPRNAPHDATLAYELRPEASVLIVGAGAGWEVQEALHFGAAHVDAVEVNPAVAEMMPKKLVNHPKVNLHVDEARSWLLRTERTYDAIVMIHTISNAATAAGALSLAEDYLFTREALEALIGKLAPGGLLFVTRPESQLPRLCQTLSIALDAPLGPHAAVWAERSADSSFYGAVLVGQAPLSTEDIKTIEGRIQSRSALRMVASPSQVPTDPMWADLMAGASPDRLKSHGLRTDPPTDDRPFFNQAHRFMTLSFEDLTRVFGQTTNTRMSLEDEPIAELSTVLLLVETTALGTLILLIPLFGRRPTRRAGRTLMYFATIGGAFMMLEVALVQRLGLLLGPPTVAFATVFAGLLVGAGLGSSRSTRLSNPTLAPVLAAASALFVAFVVPLILSPILSQPAVVRIGAGLIVSGAVGFTLGMPFPLGIMAAGRQDPALVPWGFAANGVASITGTVAALILATELGFTGVLTIAGVLYAIAAGLFPKGSDI